MSLSFSLRLNNYEYPKNKAADLKPKSRQLRSCMPELSTVGKVSFFVGEDGRASYYVSASQHHHFSIVMIYVRFELWRVTTLHVLCSFLPCPPNHPFHLHQDPSSTTFSTKLCALLLAHISRVLAAATPSTLLHLHFEASLMITCSTQHKATNLHLHHHL